MISGKWTDAGCPPDETCNSSPLRGEVSSQVRNGFINELSRTDQQEEIGRFISVKWSDYGWKPMRYATIPFVPPKTAHELCVPAVGWRDVADEEWVRCATICELSEWRGILAHNIESLSRKRVELMQSAQLPHSSPCSPSHLSFLPTSPSYSSFLFHSSSITTESIFSYFRPNARYKRVSLHFS